MCWVLWRDLSRREARRERVHARMRVFACAHASACERAYIWRSHAGSCAPHWQVHELAGGSVLVCGVCLGVGHVQLGVPTAQERSHVLQSLLAPTRPTLELMHRRQDCCCQRTWQGEEAPLQRKCYGPDRLASRGVCSKNARRGRSAKSKNGSSCWRRSAEEKWRRAFLSRRR